MFSRTDSMPKALEQSLERLQRKTIDLYQHHFPSRSVSIPELMNHMADAVEAGKIRAVGVSNYSAEKMWIAHDALAKRGFHSRPTRSNIRRCTGSRETNGVLDACRELGITLIAYSPLASGALTGKYLGQTQPKGLRRFMPNFRKNALESVKVVVELLTEIGSGTGRLHRMVALRWLIENDCVLPIPGRRMGGRLPITPGR
jgi:aryl-alcohol dehydrogenase-like predicted oxidoreductase